jgi:hypothetical protein
MRRLLVPLLCTVIATAQTPEQPVRAVTDPGVVTTRQGITPAGVPSIFQGRVYGVAFGENSSEIWVLGVSDVYRMDWKSNRILDRVKLEGTPGLQGIRFDSVGKRALVATTTTGKDRKVRLLSVAGGRATPVVEQLGSFIAGALALTPSAAHL